MIKVEKSKISLFQDYIFYLPFLMLLIACFFSFNKYFIELNYLLYTDVKCVPGEGVCSINESGAFFQEIEIYAADIRDYCEELNKDDCIGVLIKEGVVEVISCAPEDSDCY